MLEHSKCKVVHVDEEVLRPHHVVVLLVKARLVPNDLLVLTLLHELVVDVRENVIPNRQSGIQGELAGVKHTQPLKQA